MTEIIIQADELELRAELNESEASRRLLETLPASFAASRWGDEYYGDCGVHVELDDTAREILEVGELAYWPPGSALCIFFGPTPASTDDRPRAASPVIPMGRLLDDAPLAKLGGSVRLSLRRAED